MNKLDEIKARWVVPPKYPQNTRKALGLYQCAREDIPLLVRALELAAKEYHVHVPMVSRGMKIRDWLERAAEQDDQP